MYNENPMWINVYVGYVHLWIQFLTIFGNGHIKMPMKSHKICPINRFGRHLFCLRWWLFSQTVANIPQAALTLDCSSAMSWGRNWVAVYLDFWSIVLPSGKQPQFSMVQITMFHGKIHELSTGPCSVAMLVYQRVFGLINCFESINVNGYWLIENSWLIVATICPVNTIIEVHIKTR